MADDPWVFGWDQIIATSEVVVIAAAALAAYFAAIQFRRERIETRQSELAEECLSLVYSADEIFRSIRNPFQQIPEEKLSDKNYVYKDKIEKINSYKEYFDKIIDIRPRLKAVFGPNTEDKLAQILVIRNKVGYAASDLMNDQLEYEGG